MARTAKQKREIAKACADYGDSGAEKAVFTMLRRDPDAKRWLDKAIAANGMWDTTERHHIYGRSHNVEQHNWQCNIIPLHKVVHDYCHQVCKKRVELCCLYAQWQLQQEHVVRCQLNQVEDQQQEQDRFWNVPALNAICGMATLHARVDVALREIVTGTPLESIVEAVLFAIENGELPY